ncbi:zincin [Serendipita vermifera]|nr:zincin [Serendipita vermifera]
MFSRRPLRLRAHFRPQIKCRKALSVSILPPTGDEHALLDLFHATYDRPSRGSTGLFHYRQITTPQALIPVAIATMKRANYIVRRIVNAQDAQETRKIVKNIDRLSDLLCRVIDMAEFVRHTHPERAWVDAANDTYDILCEYMNGLNTNVELAAKLDHFIADPAFLTLSSEARQTALLFQYDFQKSGVHLPEEQRKKFVQHSSNIIAYGRDFLGALDTTQDSVMLTRQDCEGVPESPRLWQLYALKKGMRSSIRVRPDSAEARRVLRYSTSEEARKKIYVAQNASRPENVDILERLLRERAELAVLVGHKSYSDMLLKDKMGKSPENVKMFLQSLMDISRPRALKALEEIKFVKQKRQMLPNAAQVQAWDRDAYFPSVAPVPPLRMPPLTPGLAIFALSRLFRNMYGITLRPADLAKGEAWHKDVRKLEVVDESEGIIGWIYLDLFYRSGKAGGATHYTIRCSRRVDDDDAEGDFYSEESRGLGLEKELLLTTEEHKTPEREGLHQRPMAVISCDLDPADNHSMEWQDVLTLWHEMGHAMHSMVGRTNYSNVSGTRCATDFVELPSILMEHFLTSPDVLSLFSADGALSLKDPTPTIHTPFRAIEAHSHILLASLDQHYHSEIALSSNFNSTLELKRIQNTEGVLPYVGGTSWQTSFGHLFSYGASYYSYLFDRAIASRVWARVFRDSPMSRESGERFKNEILRYGGAKNAWEMVSDLLEEPMLREGGVEAMREVGRWGVADEVASNGPLS